MCSYEVLLPGLDNEQPLQKLVDTKRLCEDDMFHQLCPPLGGATKSYDAGHQSHPGASLFSMIFQRFGVHFAATLVKLPNFMVRWHSISLSVLQAKADQLGSCCIIDASMVIRFGLKSCQSNTPI